VVDSGGDGDQRAVLESICLTKACSNSYKKSICGAGGIRLLCY
jgi:hypothetical protein